MQVVIMSVMHLEVDRFMMVMILVGNAVFQQRPHFTSLQKTELNSDGMFHFCIADSEHDWREGTEQYKFIEHCLASADRKNQPCLIFAAHRVLGYKVDIAFYGHVHNYERSCPIYEVRKGHTKLFQKDIVDVLDKQLLEGMGVLLAEEEQQKCEERTPMPEKKNPSLTPMD